MTCRALAAALLAFLAAGGAPPAAGAGLRHLAVEGTEFVATLDDGRVLRSAGLVGAILSTAEGERIRIDAVSTEATPSGPIVLHRLSVQAGAEWQPYCQEDAAGARQGFPLPIAARADGSAEPAPPGEFSLTCTAGAQAKCVRFGYRPDGPGAAALARFNACVRMVRADYCGDGTPGTVDGTVIDLYDDAGIQAADMLPDHAFEAGWSAEGAVCVRHARVPTALDLAALRAACPRLAPLTGAACTEAAARAGGALLFNRSRP